MSADLCQCSGEEDYAALQSAVTMSGITDAAFVGGYEEHIDQRWLWTDGSEFDMQFVSAHAWGFGNYLYI